MSDQDVVATLVEDQLNDARSPVGIWELPCGYLDEGNNLHTEVQLQSYPGDAEDMMSSKRVPSDQKMDLLLKMCVVRIGDITKRELISRAIPRLHTGDRTFLFFALRRTTHGDILPFREQCPNKSCKEWDLHQFNLAQLEVIKMPDPMTQVYHVDLPDSGKRLSFKCLDGNSEKERDRRIKTMGRMTLEIFLRVVEVDGEPPTELGLKSLSGRDRDYLRAEMAKVDGGVDTSVTLGCKFCQNEWEYEIDPRTTGFFFPSETLVRLNRKYSS